MQRSCAEGVPLRWITADELYGRAGEFRDGVAAAGLWYVVEIPSNLTGWTRAPQVEPAGTVVASGRTLQHGRVADGERLARPVSELWHRGGPSWHLYRVKETEKGPVVWEVRATRFFPHRGTVPGAEGVLLVAREVRTGERKYFLAHAPTETAVAEMLCVAFARWHIERLFEDSKGEVGLDHFEVRTYRSLRRHLVLAQLSLGFLADQTCALREKNSWWSPCQVRKVVEAQLDTTVPRAVIAHRLERTAAKIAYWQRRAEEAARAHGKRRRKELRRAGIDLRRAIRCPKWV